MHDEPLPNRTCEYCGADFYDPKSQHKRCNDCPNQITPPPDDYEGTPEEWAELTPHRRWYIQNKEGRKKQIQERKKGREKMV